MSAGMPLRARILGVLRNHCTCLMPGERSDVSDALCRAAEIDRAALKAERDRYHKALYKIVQFDDGLAGEIARAALEEIKP